MISSELEAEILRLFQVEKWKKGTIASSLSLHHSVVERVLQDKCPVKNKSRKECLVTPYLSFLRETLQKYPLVPCSRLFQMARERGYPGQNPGYFRRQIAHLRPTKHKEVFLKLHMLPGEQVQIDWMDAGFVTVGKAQRKLLGMVMTLSYSRAIFVRFFLGGKTREFLQGVQEGFEFFGGAPRIILHDNLKSGVIERVGTLVRFNDQWVAFSRHFGCEPRAAGVRRGNEKGRVERSVRYIRDSFLAARPWTTLQNMNSEAKKWALSTSLERNWPEDTRFKVSEIFQEEKAKLRALPHAPYVCEEKCYIISDKYCHVRFDKNSYSIPPEYAYKAVEIVATEENLTILFGANVIATHVRSYSKQEFIEDALHLKEIRERKMQAKVHNGFARVTAVAPEIQGFLEELANRGENMGSAISSMLRMIQDYGGCVFQKAAREVCEKKSFSLRSLHFALSRQEHPMIKVPSPISDQHQGQKVIQHDPAQYDILLGIKNDNIDIGNTEELAGI